MGKYILQSPTYIAVAVVKKELTNPLFSLNIRWINAHPAHLLPPALWGILPVYGCGVQNIFLKMNSFFWILSFNYAQRNQKLNPKKIWLMYVVCTYKD